MGTAVIFHPPHESVPSPTMILQISFHTSHLKLTQTCTQWQRRQLKMLCNNNSELGCTCLHLLTNFQFLIYCKLLSK
jgi:hypothetical protein